MKNISATLLLIFIASCSCSREFPQKKSSTAPSNIPEKVLNKKLESPASKEELKNSPNKKWTYIWELREAISEGDIRAVQRFKKLGIPFTAGGKPYDAIFSARTPEMVSFLIQETKANPNSVDSQQNTPLFFARSASHAKALIQEGADVNWNKGISRPLHYHLRYTAPDIQILKVLLENGANPKLKDKKGRTAMKRFLEKKKEIMRALHTIQERPQHLKKQHHLDLEEEYKIYLNILAPQIEQLLLRYLD